MSKFGLGKVLLGIALVLLPGSILLLSLVLLISSRRRLQNESSETSPDPSNSVPAQADLAQLVTADVPAVQLASA